MSYLPGQIIAKRAASPTITLLDLHVPYLKSFEPGQWLDFRVPTESWIGGFSIASHPATLPNLQIAVKESSHAPAAWVTHCAKPLQQVLIRVDGSCVLHPDASKRAIFVAGGIGISPMLSLYRHHATQQRPPSNFFYCVQNDDEVVFQQELLEILSERPHDQLTITLTRSQWTNPTTERGVTCTTGRKLGSFLKETKDNDAVYYVCGPPSMQDEAIAMLKGQGAHALVYEQWW